MAWLRRIRVLYRHDRRRRGAQAASAEFTAADAEPRLTVADMRAQTRTELADPKRPTPCRKVLASLHEHWTGLTRFDWLEPLLGRSANLAGQQRRRADHPQTRLGPQELPRLRVVMERTAGDGALSPVRHFDLGQDQSAAADAWLTRFPESRAKTAAEPRPTSIGSYPGRCRWKSAARWPSIPTTVPELGRRPSLEVRVRLGKGTVPMRSYVCMPSEAKLYTPRATYTWPEGSRASPEPMR